MLRLTLCTTALCSIASLATAATVLVETESFSSPGGWSLDTQFIR